MEEKDWLQRMSEENQIQKVLQTNPFTGASGLHCRRRMRGFWYRRGKSI